MTGDKELINLIKVRSDRYLERIKKDSANILKLLKKVKRKFGIKNIKNTINVQHLLKIYDDIDILLIKREATRISDLKNLTQDFHKLSNTSFLKPIENLRNLTGNLTSLDEEVTPVNDVTLTEEKLGNYSLDLNTNENIDTAIDEVVAYNDTDTCNDMLKYEVHVQLENINVINENKENEDTFVSETKDINSTSYSNEVVMSEVTDTIFSKDKNREFSNEEPLHEVLNKSYSSKTHNTEISHNSTIGNDSNDSNSNDKMNNQNYTKSTCKSAYQSSKVSVADSITSTISISKTETPNRSGLFKSKFHSTLNIAQKSASKPQIKVLQSNTLKRKQEDVKRQKEQIEAEKRQKLMKKVEEDALKAKRIEDLRKCTQNALQLSQLKVTLPKAITKNNLKREESSKIIPLPPSKIKRELSTSKANQQTPLIQKTLQQASVQKVTNKISASQKLFEQTSASQKIMQQQLTNHKINTYTSTNNQFNKPILKPINKISNISVNHITAPIIAPIYVNGNTFKTPPPPQKKVESKLTESCRKIVLNHETYSLAGLESDNSDDDDIDHNVPIPSWASKQGGTLGRLSEYHTMETDPESVFKPPTLISLKISEVFATYEYHEKARKSSAVWTN